MTKEQRGGMLANEIEHCHKCPGMNQPGKTKRQQARAPRDLRQWSSFES